jgi:hypothetical protein
MRHRWLERRRRFGFVQRHCSAGSRSLRRCHNSVATGNCDGVMRGAIKAQSASASVGEKGRGVGCTKRSMWWAVVRDNPLLCLVVHPMKLSRAAVSFMCCVACTRPSATCRGTLYPCVELRIFRLGRARLLSVSETLAAWGGARNGLSKVGARGWSVRLIS